MARYGWRIQGNGRVAVPPDDMFAVRERLFAPVADDPACDARRNGVSSLVCCTRERVAESVNGSNQAWLSAAFSQRFTQFRNEARQRRFRHKRRWPEPLVQLALRHCPRPRVDEHEQQLVGLRREMYRLLLRTAEQLPGVDVERERSERDRSRHAQKIPQKLPKRSKDS